MMWQFRWPVAIVALALALGGCQSVRDLAGQGKRPPDEFTVYSRSPLSVPPDFALRPPGSGTTAPSSAAAASAKQALLGSGATPPGGSVSTDTAALAAASSPGIAELLTKTGATSAEPDIRGIVNRETTILADADYNFTDRLLFWKTPTEYGAVVDPVQEAKRIQDNQALGKPIVTGATPTIERKRRAILEGIF